MPGSLSRDAIVAKEWDALGSLMRCPGQSDEMPLNLQLVIEPFECWALDFIGPINPSSNQKTYILVATEYVTKRVEAKALPRAIEDSVIYFLFQLFV